MKNLKYVNCYFIYFLYIKVNCDLLIELLLCSDYIEVYDN